MLAAIAAALLATTPVVDFDVWCHVRTGADILATGHFPSPDRYSFTAAGRRYDAHEWLAQVILRVAACGGAAGLVAVKVGALAGFVVVISALGEHRATAALLALGGAWLVLPRIHERPHLATLLGVAIAMGMWNLRPPRVAAAFALGIAWSNLHGGAAILLPLLIGKLVGDRLERRPARPAIASVVGALAGASCNPAGPLLFLAPLSIGEHGSFRSIVQEWTPMLDPSLVGNPVRARYVLACVLLGCAIVAGMFRPRAFPWRWIPFAIAAALLPLRAARYVEVAIPAVAALGALALPALPEPPALRRGGVAIVAALAALSPWGFARRLASVPPLGASLGPEVPEQAARFLDSVDLHGRMYDEMQLGCYLLYARPRDPVFIDGRVTVYGSAFLDRFQRASSDPRELGKLLDEYAIDYAVLRLPAPDAAAEVACHRYLAGDAGMAPIYTDDAVAIYVRAAGAHADLAARLGLHAIDPLDPVAGALSGDPRARAELDRLVELAPRSARILTSAALARARSGDAGAAIPLLARAVEMAPESSVSWWAMSVTLLQSGDARGALAASDRAVALARSPAAHAARARALRALGREAEAVSEEEAARAIRSAGSGP